VPSDHCCYFPNFCNGLKPIPANGVGPQITFGQVANLFDGATNICTVDYAAGEESKVVNVNFDCYDMNVTKYNMTNNATGNGFGDSV